MLCWHAAVAACAQHSFQPLIEVTTLPRRVNLYTSMEPPPQSVRLCSEKVWCTLQLLYVWDLDQSKRPGGEPEAKRARGAYPPQLLFTHAGHRASVSVQMQHCVPGTLANP